MEAWGTLLIPPLFLVGYKTPTLKYHVKWIPLLLAWILIYPLVWFGDG